jgi:hypothetical protein
LLYLCEELLAEPTQVALAEDDQVIETLLSGTAKKPLNHGIHPRGAYCIPDDPNASPLRHPIELSPLLVVQITDDELRSCTERSDIAELLGSPL